MSFIDMRFVRFVGVEGRDGICEGVLLLWIRCICPGRKEVLHQGRSGKGAGEHAGDQFQKVIGHATPYERCNIQMELSV